MARKVLGEAVFKQGLNYLVHDPEKNLVQLAKWGARIARAEQHKRTAEKLAEILGDEDNNWRRLVLNQLRQVSPRVRERLVLNFFVNAALIGIPYSQELEKKLGVHIPWAMLIDPTGRCNLRCKGCWAAEYDRSKDMDLETLDRIITEAENLGIHFIVVSGGEPTIRMNDLITLAGKHEESAFHVFTNGTLLDKNAARTFAELGNVTFAISLEGFEETTDRRRGPGVYARIMRAMDNLREAGVLFGFSATYTRENANEIGSEPFINLMVEKGCAYGWLFTYVPVGGAGADLEYMATPEQRATMYRTVRRWRQEKPIFVADFWNDGPAVGGCIAGGRSYFHINAMGDVEPCAFVHFANVNIKNTTLLEALSCPLFRTFQANQPFNHNLLRPCPIIDNPQMLEKIVAESGAYSTEAGRVSAGQLCRPLYGYATAWGEIADRLWAAQEQTVPSKDKGMRRDRKWPAFGE
ncbi:MAG: radical SAM protein [Firmicutes bacterium]|nr:radical SAM protein [Bacillota bacterium]